MNITRSYNLSIGKSSYARKDYAQKPCSKNVLFKSKVISNIPDSFVSTTKNLATNFEAEIRRLSAEGFESKTLEELYTPKYKPTRRFNECGYPVTTIIDKLTGKPVEVFVKDFSVGNRKNYRLYLNSDTKCLVPIGRREFWADPEIKMVTPEYMSSCPKNARYRGIGIRCHQLAVETAMLNNYSKIQLNALKSAYPFHKKCLFKDSANMEFSSQKFKEYVENFREYYMLSEAEAYDLLKHKKDGNAIILLYKDAKAQIEKVTGALDDLYMELSGERLELWKKMAASQPILLP
ncbi:MAG: hypothetical protein MJ237_01580 [bacterium]|nr:hypothetical protein [bacterium]